MEIGHIEIKARENVQKVVKIKGIIRCLDI